MKKSRLVTAYCTAVAFGIPLSEIGIVFGCLFLLSIVGFCAGYCRGYRHARLAFIAGGILVLALSARFILFPN